MVSKGEGAVSLSPSNLINMKLNFEDCTYLSWFKYEESPEIQLNISDVVVVKTGSSYGKSALVDILPEKTTLNPQLMVLKQLHCNSRYLCYLLNTQYMKKNFEELVNGTAIPTFSQEKFGMKYFPLPPSKEQDVIIAEIERIFSLIGTLETDKSDLQIAIKQAKSKILDLAIHGKLVPQDSSDEPASVLLEKLRAEKEAKIKAGDLKRDKNDSYIYKNTTDNCYYQKFIDGKEIDITEEIPFELPENWKWCCGTELFNPMKSRKPSGDTFNYIDIETIDNKKHKVIKPKTLKVSESPSRASREISNGDVLFSLVRPYLENIALISKEHQDCIASTGFYVCKPNKALYSKYLFLLMTSNYVVQGLNQFMKGDNSPSINGDDITKWFYPLPPLAEQKRIVEKIEKIFKNLDEIVENLHN